MDYRIKKLKLKPEPKATFCVHNQMLVVVYVLSIAGLRLVNRDVLQLLLK